MTLFIGAWLWLSHSETVQKADLSTRPLWQQVAACKQEQRSWCDLEPLQLLCTGNLIS